jgi:hypothetical protein
MKSKIWEFTKEEFEQIIKNNRCMADVCKSLGFRKEGGNYKTIKRRITLENIDTSHFLSKKELFSSKNTNFVTKEQLLSRLNKNDDINGVWLKSKLIKFDLLKNECSICKIKNTWNGMPLNLQLDHIDGNHTNNNFENLRVLCPNCHSQTDTFCGKSKKTKTVFCKECNLETAGTNLCWTCSMKKLRKVTRPDKETLEAELKDNTFVSIGEKYGVSDNSVRKWCKSYHIKI